MNMSINKLSINLENIIWVIIKTQKLKFSTLLDLKDSSSQDHSHQEVEPIIHKISYQMKENMSFLKISLQERESSFSVEENLLLILAPEDLKVNFICYSSPWTWII